MMASPNPAFAGSGHGHNGHGRPTFAGQPFLDKKNVVGLRTSTPGSEALDSSEDERETPAAMSASMHSVKSNPPNPLTQRRPSWLSEVQQSSAQSKPNTRKFSIGGASHTSSNSQPTTPLNENGPWEMAANTGRPGTSGTGHMWSSQIWQKDRPSRLSEVMQSPSNSMHQDDLRSPTSLAPGGLPFEIPLEPNRKTIRSQSYSAGQLEKIPGMEHLQQQQPGYARMRSVAHRPSRPSMLGEGSRDMLSSLREDEDDAEDLSGSDSGYPLHTTTSLQNPPRALNTYAKAPSPLPNAGYRLQARGTFPMSSGSDYAVADEDNNDNSQDLSRAVARNVIGGGSSNSSSSSATVLASASARSKWQSQLGFGIGEDGSQSRRHSFAAEQLPSRTRNNSMAAANAVALPSDLGQHIQYGGGYNSLNSPFAHMEQNQHLPQPLIHEDRKYTNFTKTDFLTRPHSRYKFNSLSKIDTQDELVSVRGFNSATNKKGASKFRPIFNYPSLRDKGKQMMSEYSAPDRSIEALSSQLQQHERTIQEAHQVDSSYAASYFGGTETMRRNMRDATESYNPFALPNVFSRPQRILYLVVFKCSRADIYYIPENTGLQVKTGDTVIVEGDRGQDLGTVEAINITMDIAKKLKEEYLRKQYKCLMMFSRMYPHIAAIANDDEQFEQAIIASKNMQQNSMHGGQPQQESEPRPKMIKRVARPDEVHLLREKEGNEAKAKRVCQTKVNDHGLRMEILDAEFQHDYRKLTFFYYAEEYINFNDLVTDLFKVYKTRIWMSAINPASFTGAGNPHTGQRAQQWPRNNPPSAFMRPQDHQLAAEGARTQSPIDYDSPAARGNREFERLYGNTGFSGGMGIPAGMDRIAPTLHSDYTPSMPSPYGIPGAAAAPFSPNANQFTPFANQFGNMGVPWSQSHHGLGIGQQQYQYPEATPTNYSIGPGTSTGNTALNQQAAAFTPRTATGSQGQAQGQRSAPRPNQGTNGNGHHANQDQDVDAVQEQLRRFNMNQRPQ